MDITATVTLERAQWVVVAAIDRPETYPALRQTFAESAWVEVVVDRRQGERRQHTSGYVAEQRERCEERGADQHEMNQRLAE